MDRLYTVLAVATLTLCSCTCGDDGLPPDAGPAESGIPDAGLADADAGVPDAGFDAGGVDAGRDAGVDAGPLLDDAGCPVPTNVVLDAADAGLPAGLRLWLRTDVGLVTHDGGAICRWEDVSGNGQHFTPGTSTPPSRSASGLRGHPSVTFATDKRHLLRSGVLNIPPASGRTIAVISLTRDLTTRYQSFVQGRANSGGIYLGLDMNTWTTVGQREGVYVTDCSYDADLATAAEVRTHVYSIASMAPGALLPNVLQYSVNGTLRTLTRTPGGVGNGTVEDFSTADYTALGGAMSGFSGAELGDVLVWDRALTSNERAQVEAYFAARFP